MSLSADLEPHNTPRRRSCDTVWFANFGGIRVRPLGSLEFVTVTNGFGAAQQNSWEIDILGWLWRFSPQHDLLELSGCQDSSRKERAPCNRDIKGRERHQQRHVKPQESVASQAKSISHFSGFLRSSSYLSCHTGHPAGHLLQTKSSFAVMIPALLLRTPNPTFEASKGRRHEDTIPAAALPSSRSSQLITFCICKDLQAEHV